MAKIRHNSTIDDFEITTTAEGTRTIAGALAASKGAFTATVGSGQDYANMDDALTAAEAAGASKSILYIVGSVVIGGGAARIYKGQLDVIGAASTPTLTFDQQLKTAAAGDNEDQLWRFFNLLLEGSVVACIFLEKKTAVIEFHYCDLRVSAGSDCIVLQNNVAGINNTIRCIDCDLIDDFGGTAAFFLGAVTINIFLHGTTDSGTSGTASLLKANVTGYTGNLYILDGTVIDTLTVKNDTAVVINFFRDASSTMAESQLLTTSPAPTIVNVGGDQIRESSGPTLLDVGAIADNDFLLRAGLSVVGRPAPVANAVTTTDGVFTTIATIPIPDDTVVQVRANVVARRTDAADSVHAIIQVGVFREAAGVATLIGGFNLALLQGTGAGDVQFVVSGNDLLLQVEGAAAETFNWKSEHELLSVA